MQHGGNGVSVEKQYYYIKMRSQETTLVFAVSSKLSTCGAKIRIHDFSRDVRRKHVEYTYGRSTIKTWLND